MESLNEFQILSKIHINSERQWIENGGIIGNSGTAAHYRIPMWIRETDGDGWRRIVTSKKNNCVDQVFLWRFLPMGTDCIAHHTGDTVGSNYKDRCPCASIVYLFVDLISFIRIYGGLVSE